MSESSLLEYIKEGFELDSDFYDAIRFNIGKVLYQNGEYYRGNKEKVKLSFRQKIRNFEIKIINNLKIIITNNKKIRNKPKILSSAYFYTNAELMKLGYNVYRPVWSTTIKKIFIGNRSLYKESERIRNVLNKGTFRKILSKEFQGRVESYRKNLKEYYSKQNIKALIVPFDISFFPNIAIKIFQELEIPTFVFLHGIPARYDKYDNNRADYLIVWGGFLKEMCVKTGAIKEKVFVSGHPNYKNNPPTKLRFDFSDILIITKGVSGSASTTTAHNMSDRGNIILYLFKIQKVLIELGVKSVRYRPHPLEKISWYEKFLDPNFFILDQETLIPSLKKSSLVIGPGSTVFIEALYHGVNYILYEPSINGVDIINHPIVPPFDGSISEILVAKNEGQLKDILENKKVVDLSIFNQIIKMPFDLSFIKKLIN